MKKGFTLIELLAVIVILAVIATIAIPVALNIINDIKFNSVKSSMNNIEKALNLYYYENKNGEEIVFNCEDSVCETQDGDKLKVSGKLPSEGIITISKSGNITYDTVVLNGYLCDKIDGEFTCNLASKNTVTSEGESIIINNNKSTTLNNYKIYGNSVQNGVPTLDTPIEIESVASPKNLFNPAWDTRFTLQEDGSYLSNTIISTDINILGSEKLPIGIYTIFVKVKSPVGKNYRIRVIYSDETYTDSFQNSTGEYIDIRLTTIEKEIKEIIWYYGSSSSEVQFKEFQIEEGTVATTYEPYGEDKYKIQVKASGKNLININSMLTIDILVDNGDNTYSIGKTSNGRFSTIQVVNIPAHTPITVSFEQLEFTGSYHQSMLFEFKTAFESKYIGLTLEETQKTVTYDTIITGIRLYQADGNDLGSYTKFKNLMIEYGDTATSYEPYMEPVITNIYLDEPLRKIGNYVDYIDFKSSKLIRNVGSITLNGQEVWREKDGIYYLDESIGVSLDKEMSISTHFVYKEESNFWIDEFNKINIKHDGVENLEEFKDWLENNNVTIHYPLKRSTVEEIDVPKINLNEKYSNISIDTSVKPSKLLLEYD